ncbi:complement C1q-like protein 4 [Mya arenaria]|uniref:complement C1q-like protein 4 n=1 Tax=Mya arenaria TaxID=6604 RepID=UPI0022E4DD62|nr:complement C1q-like protein 4 [Mya arenaria]
MSKVAIVLFVLVGICHGLDIEAVLERLESLERKVAGQGQVIAAQAKHIEELELKVNPDKRLVFNGEGPIAFTSQVSPRVVRHMHDGDGVIFDRVLLNAGGGYNNATGSFTVPLSGIYLFAVSVFDHMATAATGNAKIHAEIVQNNSTIGRVFAHADMHNRDQGAETVIVTVNTGDVIWVRVVDNNDLGLGGEFYTSFAGYMLWQM